MPSPHKPTNRTDPVLQLITDYYFTADFMHREVHRRRDRLFAMLDAGRGTGVTRLEREFKSCMNLWLSTLWVVAHALRHVLKVGPVELNKLIDENFISLSAYRNATFHYNQNPDKHVQFFHGQLNWAEELHAAVTDFLADYANNLSEAIKPKKPQRRRPKIG